MSLVGIDEAGRGALAGPLCVCACVLNKDLKGLKDSKLLSPKARQELFELISINSSYLILFCSNSMIDELGLSVCFKRALSVIKRHFDSCEFLFDGNTNFGVSGIKTMIKADNKISEVSAASILAKVSRDKFMSSLNDKYEFKKHKGYASALHMELIKRYGFSSLHRKSFVLKSLEPSLFN